MGQTIDQVLSNGVRAGYREVLRIKVDFVAGNAVADVGYWLSESDRTGGAPVVSFDYPLIPLAELQASLQSAADTENAVGAFLAAQQAESLEGAQQRARDVIDAAAGTARARFVTVAPGQDGTYAFKFAQAEAYLAAGAPEDATAYPWVALEAQETGKTPAEAAQRIVATGTPWTTTIGPLIESKRVGFKDKITAATTVDAVLDLMREGLSALDAIRPA